MPSAPKNPQALVEHTLREHNRDFGTRAIAAAVMGALTTLGVFIAIALICFVVRFGRSDSLLIAGAVFLVYLAIAVWCARRGVDPLAKVEPLTEDDLGMIKATYAATGMLASPRHTVAGAADLLLHGPRSLLQSIGLWRSRFASEPAAIAAAGALLARCLKHRTIPAADADALKWAPLLLSLGLIRFDQPPGSRLLIHPTGKAIDALSAA